MISLLQILKMETLFHRGVGTSLNALGLDLNKATEVQLPDKPKLDDMAGAEFGPGAGKVSERAVDDTSLSLGQCTCGYGVRYGLLVGWSQQSCLRQRQRWAQ